MPEEDVVKSKPNNADVNVQNVLLSKVFIANVCLVDFLRILMHSIGVVVIV